MPHGASPTPDLEQPRRGCSCSLVAALLLLPGGLLLAGLAQVLSWLQDVNRSLAADAHHAKPELTDLRPVVAFGVAMALLGAGLLAREVKRRRRDRATAHDPGP